MPDAAVRCQFCNKSGEETLIMVGDRMCSICLECLVVMLNVVEDALPGRLRPVFVYNEPTGLMEGG
jgi:hypothetical protein